MSKLNGQGKEGSMMCPDGLMRGKGRRGEGADRRHRKTPAWAIAVSALGLLSFAALLLGQTATDPGVRPGKMAGNFISGLTTNQAAVEGTTTGIFIEINQVTNTTGKQSDLVGLGPGFDSNSCSSCHAQPAIGGSSPATNPLTTGSPPIYQIDGATNTLPSFETPTGPVVVARFPFKADGVTPDGTVHQLFSVQGRSDAPGCTLAQPPFSTMTTINRQTLPVFGDGLIEIIQDSDILANMNANLSQKLLLGISGHPNRAADGSINRFGWKAQTRSLVIFGGEAYNIEEGVSNEMFPNEINDINSTGCILNPVPEDHTNYALTKLPPHRFPGDPEEQAVFMRFLAPPTVGGCPGGVGGGCPNGQTQFNNVGCVLCHTTSFTTPSSAIGALSNLTANLFSDLLVHDMGPCNADNVTQGTATGDQFRTPPLWGAGQRVFFMSDGRTTNIVTAVEDHFCLGNSQYPNSEANAVINNFNALDATDQQDLINFLRQL